MLERRSFALSRCRLQKNVAGEVAIAIVVAVEEAAFLMAVQWIVSRYRDRG